MDLPGTTLMEVPIELKPEAKAFFVLKPYRLAQCEQEAVKKQISEMVDCGILEPCNSEFSSPYLVVKKKSGAYRFVSDLRKLNTLLKERDHFPLPSIEEILTSLAGEKWFSSLDLFSGFFQVPIRKENRHVTAFVTPMGQFCYCRLPQGMTNSPHIFQRCMKLALGDLINTSCYCYLDDVVVFGTSFEEHNSNLVKVFDAFRKANLRLQAAKCSFAMTRMNFLGHVISASGVEPDTEKLRAIQDFPVPVNRTTLKGFLGLAGYYRMFVKNFSAIAHPLNELLRKDVEWSWNQQRQEAFDKLKKMLMEPPTLMHYDSNLPILVHTDASGYGLGAILSHIGPDGKEHPVAYYSRSLNKHERNYSITMKEMLGIHFALKKVRSYVFGQEFTLVTDHNALTALLKLTDPQDKLARWQAYISAFQPFSKMKVVHRKGKVHHNADALSRSPLPDTIPEKQDTDLEIPILSADLEELKREQEKDPLCTWIRGTLSSSSRFIEKDGILYKVEKDPLKRNLTVLPRTLLEKNFREIHTSTIGGHLGPKKMLAKFQERFYLRNMGKVIKRRCQECKLCQIRKSPSVLQHSTCGAMPTSDTPFEKICIDYCGPLPTTSKGNKHILAIVDIHSRCCGNSNERPKGHNNGISFAR